MTFSWESGTQILSLSHTPSAAPIKLTTPEAQDYGLTPADFSCITDIKEELSSFRKIQSEQGNARIESDGKGFTSTIIDLRSNPSPGAVSLLEDLVSAFNKVVEDYERIDELRVVE